MSISDRLDQIEQGADAATSLTLGDDNARACYNLAEDEIPALVAALRAVLAINTGDNRSLYGVDFEAGMCKALAIVHQTIAAALGEGS